MGILRERGPISTEGFQYQFLVFPDDQTLEVDTRRDIHSLQLEMLRKLAEPPEHEIKHDEWQLPLFE